MAAASPSREPWGRKSKGPAGICLLSGGFECKVEVCPGGSKPSSWVPAGLHHSTQAGVGDQLCWINVCPYWATRPWGLSPLCPKAVFAVALSNAGQRLWESLLGVPAPLQPPWSLCAWDLSCPLSLPAAHALLPPELSYVGSSPSLKVNMPPVVSRETGVCFAFAGVMSEALC